MNTFSRHRRLKCAHSTTKCGVMQQIEAIAPQENPSQIPKVNPPSGDIHVCGDDHPFWLYTPPRQPDGSARRWSSRRR